MTIDSFPTVHFIFRSLHCLNFQWFKFFRFDVCGKLTLLSLILVLVFLVKMYEEKSDSLRFS